MSLEEEKDVENIYNIIMDYNRKNILSKNNLFEIIQNNKSLESNYNKVLLYIVKKLSYNDWEIINCLFFKIQKIV